LENSQTTPPDLEQNQASPIDPVAGKSVAEIFGEIVWLMTQDKSSRELSIKDLEHLVMPGILLRQFHIQYAEVLADRPPAAVSTKATLVPVSVEIFAMCSPAVSIALEADPRITLTILDWRSGTIKKKILSIGRVEQ
jgi:hemolysin-activating ACP:hemolysin acyltransferase